MNQAIKTLALLSALLVTLVHSTTLKSPKVYNALITTDQNLIPSRAYPVVQPTIHDAGFGYSAFGLAHHHNAFGLYDPYHHGGFVPGPLPGYQARNHFSYFSQGKSAAGAVAAEETASGGTVTNDQAILSGNDAQLDAGSVANTNVLKENPPIPLNEFGLPPNLIPLSTGQDFNRQNPVNLQPYPYNSYPLIYDSFGGGYNVNPYLPPFGYYPSVFGGPGAAGAPGLAAGPGAVDGGVAGAAGSAGGVGGVEDIGGVGGAGGAGGAGGDDGDVDGAGGDLDGNQGGDIDGGAGGDDGGAGGGSGVSGGDGDGGAIASEKQSSGGDGGSGSSSGASSSGGSSSSTGSSGSSTGSTSSSSGYRSTTRRTGFRGSNIRSALRSDSDNVQ
ncbi:PE-PGRS family protein PE_PGRS3 [Phlebotomus argentipes]|uniref:PE-PGRS family protein PE_PGRS3 n=1 Tax=Phlebotomus argentipes TaxID=94469 RepID=UPI002893603D|nr:PE-PGRS family protein PE_PGRS3 [Phlebotomus argentipes]XP_059619435.1 PE-PGRS family protein PE_PGRS3 [Phlebotomus argentipes]XP_059619436.1 PE-PGRS family protein PE_PGRS3 [Phlebotomus argentipes]